MALRAVEDMRHDPLILFCTPRGGSSLVAGVFVRHGLWVGETFGGPDGVGAGGYVNYENTRIKKYMKNAFPLDAGNHDYPVDVANHSADLQRFCAKVVPPETAWMFKGPSEYYLPFVLAFPRMTPVMIFRDESQAVETHVRRYGEKVRQGATEIVRKRFSFMEEVLASNPKALRVDADRIVNGDTGQIAPILARYDIDLDHRLAMEGISPEMFHQ